MLVNEVPIVMICDDAYVMPTSVAITSMLASKHEDTTYAIYVLTPGLSPEHVAIFEQFSSSTVRVSVIRAAIDHLAELHCASEDSICVASVAALLKFEIPQLLPHLDRVLYLDGDLIVRDDLSELFGTDMGDCLAGAVSDTGQIYYKHAFVMQTENYFNSGVMILNLGLMRRLGVTETLISKKASLADSSLMDQNVFNIVFQGRMRYLPVKYNLLYVNLLRAEGKYSVDDINALCGGNYSTLDEINKDAVIVHFSSKAKPWKYADVPLADEWYLHYRNSPFGLDEAGQEMPSPKVSVIIPVYNVEPFLRKCLNGVLNQTLKELEVICVDDASQDRSDEILEEYRNRDSRVKVLTHERNRGQSAARNRGLKVATGEYIYFLDADDFIEETALEYLYEVCLRDVLDVIFFDAIAYFENDSLRNQHTSYETYYTSNQEYQSVYTGQELFVELVNNFDYRPSPCLQFIRAEFLREKNLGFHDGVIHEDNLFSLLCILQAERATHVKKALYHRLVRENSTMTTKEGYRNFLGYFVCACEMFNFVNSKDGYPSDVLGAAFKQVAGMYRRAGAAHAKLPAAKKKRIRWEQGSTEDLFFRLLKSDDSARVAEKRLQRITASRSYRISRVLTYIPRRIRKMVKHLRST